jgi:para-aminobenzoate synthetase component I
MSLYPTFEIFSQKAQSGTFFPFLEEIDSRCTPQIVYDTYARGKDPSFLLESSRLNDATGRYSWVLGAPFMTFRSHKNRCVINRLGKTVHLNKDPFQALRELFLPYRMAQERHLPPFLGGAVGLLSFELKNSIEKPLRELPDPYGLPDADLAFFEEGVVFDHKRGQTFVFCLQEVNAGSRKEHETGLRRCRDLAQTVSKAAANKKPKTQLSGDPFSHIELTDPERFDENAPRFHEMVRQAKVHIRYGEIFQVNLSHCLSIPYAKDPFVLYQKQIKFNPTSFAAYVQAKGYTLVSGSPERLVSLRDGWAKTRPIAGTRPRVARGDEDHRFSLELRLNPKERAEHIMLIDLERNDLGRVCEYGSVHVDEFMREERYSHVRHMVSNVTGRLKNDRDVFDLLRSVFPGGTVTGAPKVRAMQIIDALEGQARGAYTGSLGYLSFSGNCDFNIMIRSLLVKDNRAFLQVGAGIVADSDPQKEYRETIDKARAFLKVLYEPTPVLHSNR